MKKTIALCVVLIAMIAAPAYSQVEFGIGMKGGINFGTVSIDPDFVATPGAPPISKSGSTGLMIGAVGELGFAKMFYIALEPTYCQHGVKYTQGTGSLAFNYNCLNFPILFKVKFMKGVIRPYGFLGPNLGIVLSATSVPGTGAETDIKPTTSGLDFALDFGGGAEYNVTPKLGITGDVRYSLGLSNINNLAGSTTTVKTRGFQILFGVIFHVI